MPYVSPQLPLCGSPHDDDGLTSETRGQTSEYQGAKKKDKADDVYDYLVRRRLRDAPLLTQISVILILGIVAYGFISIAIYFVAGREMSRRGLENARLGRLFVIGWLACALATYCILLLR
jgi:hypothetical protein